MINSCNSIFFFCQKTINTILVISYKLNDEKRDLMRKFSYSIFSKITIKPGCQSIKIQFLVKCVFFQKWTCITQLSVLWADATLCSPQIIMCSVIFKMLLTKLWKENYLRLENNSMKNSNMSQNLQKLFLWNQIWLDNCNS